MNHRDDVISAGPALKAIAPSLCHASKRTRRIDCEKNTLNVTDNEFENAPVCLL